MIDIAGLLQRVESLLLISHVVLFFGGRCYNNIIALLTFQNHVNV